MARYVILEHDQPARHWDFMLEAGDVLRTWRLEEPPDSGRMVRASTSFDHRLIYLDYEGPISGGRGSVARWDSGTFRWVTDSAEQVTVDLAGSRLHGTASLRHISDREWSLELTKET